MKGIARVRRRGVTLFGIAVLLVLTASQAVAINPAAAQTYSYQGTWNGTLEGVTKVANVTVEGLADSQLVGTLDNFQTSDPAYSCLDGEDVNVFTAPKEFPGSYVVHNGLQGPQCTYGTWTFPRAINYQIIISSWIPQYQIVDPSTGGLAIPYAADGLPPPSISNCWSPPWWAYLSTVVVSTFGGDNHTGFGGTYRSQSILNFTWNGSSISNVSYNLEIGTSHRILTYAYAGIFGAGTAQCVEAATATLLSPAPTVGATSFTLTTQSQVAFISYAPTIFAQLEGSFSGGQLNLSWDTGKFPSYGYQVIANGQVQATNVVNDASYLSPIATSAAAIPVIYDGLECPFYPALPPLFYGSPCNTGNASVTVP